MKWSLIKELKWSLSLIKELKWSLMKEYCKTLETLYIDLKIDLRIGLSYYPYKDQLKKLKMHLSRPLG